MIELSIQVSFTTLFPYFGSIMVANLITDVMQVEKDGSDRNGPDDGDGLHIVADFDDRRRRLLALRGLVLPGQLLLLLHHAYHDRLWRSGRSPGIHTAAMSIRSIVFVSSLDWT